MIISPSALCWLWGLNYLQCRSYNSALTQISFFYALSNSCFVFFPLFQVWFGPKVGAFVIWYLSHPYWLSSSLLTWIQLCWHRSAYWAVFLICLYFIFHIDIIKVSYIFNTEPLSIWFSRCWKLNLLNKDSSSNFFWPTFYLQSQPSPVKTSRWIEIWRK